MAHLIDKDAVVTEIESKRKYAQTLGDNAINSSMQQFYDGMKQGCVDIISFLDTLEVKNVDLEKEISSWVEDNTCRGYCSANIHETAEHFFELGLKTQNGE